MDNFDLKKYITEGKIYEDNFSSNGYQITYTKPDLALSGDGTFLPLFFEKFRDEVNPRDFDSVRNFIRDSIYQTISWKVDEVYEMKENIFKKEIEKEREKMENDFKNNRISGAEYDEIEEEIEKKENQFYNIDKATLIDIDMDNDGGSFEIINPLTDSAEVSGEFNIF